MMTYECSREEDVLGAIGTGRWPNRVDAELRAHVEQCAMCRDVATVVIAFEDASQNPESEGSGLRMDSGVMWFRAQLRARADATKTAARPITVVQALSFASIVGLLGVLLGASSSWLQTGVRWLGGMAQALNPRVVSLPAGVLEALTAHVTLIGVAGGLLLLMPIGVYFAMKEPRT